MIAGAAIEKHSWVPGTGEEYCPITISVAVGGITDHGDRDHKGLVTSELGWVM